jgi:hypothetical protein
MHAHDHHRLSVPLSTYESWTDHQSFTVLHVLLLLSDTMICLATYDYEARMLSEATKRIFLGFPSLPASFDVLPLHDCPPHTLTIPVPSSSC